MGVVLSFSLPCCGAVVDVALAFGRRGSAVSVACALRAAGIAPRMGMAGRLGAARVAPVVVVVHVVVVRPAADAVPMR